MARKRERKAPLNSDRRKDHDEPKNRGDRVAEPASDRNRITVSLLLLIVIPAVSILLYNVKFSRHGNPRRTSLSIRQRGLIKTEINYREILSEHSTVSENVSDRHYDYPVLAYITPWNSKGYEIAKTFNSKFTHISPVWYDLKSNEETGGLILEGRHNADEGWIQDLRSRGNALVLPRVVLEASPKDLLKKKKVRDRAIDLIVTECIEMEYDGVVLESWSRWAAYGILHDAGMRKLAIRFIKEVGDALHQVNPSKSTKKQMQLVYVIGAPRSDEIRKYDFGPEDLHSLKDHVDGFSLMTYDFSNEHNPGPNAPMKWIEYVLKLLLGSSNNADQSLGRKIFLGINFYGNDFALSPDSDSGAITGRDYLSLLEKHRPDIRWDNSGEHFFLYPDDKNVKHAVFYPSLMSILLRLENARSWGTGISIWEIGQGLDYFYDLL